MNSKHPESDTLAFIEALAGEFTGANPTRRSWQQCACDLTQEFVAAFEADFRAPVVFRP